MLPKKYNFRESEPKWQKYWEEEKVYKFSQEVSGPVYSIDTPPPTVSGSIHIGHVYSYTQAEIIARFCTGYFIPLVLTIMVCRLKGW